MIDKAGKEGVPSPRTASKLHKQVQNILLCDAAVLVWPKLHKIKQERLNSEQNSMD